MADETGRPVLDDCGGAVVVVETIPQRLQGVCWTGDNLDAVQALAGDAWLGVTLRGNPLVVTTGGTRPELELGWWLLVDWAGGVIVSAVYAAARTYRLAGDHAYRSTACFHAVRDGRDDLHGYCQNTEGQAGPKTAARCKWCPSPCSCACHQPVGTP